MNRMLRIIGLSSVVAVVLAVVANAASSPSVATGGQKSVKQTSVTLLGTVNPNGSATSYFFQWGLTNAYGDTGRVHSAGSGTKVVNVSGYPSGLLPGTVYHYRLVAFNRYGTSAGADRTLTTAGPPPPGAATGSSTQPSANGVTVTGVINPNGATTGWRFEYGLTSSYTTFTSGGSVPSGKTPVIVSEALAGLEPGTIFHYRLVAFHGTVATSYGTDEIFMTEPSPRPKPTFSVATRPRRAAHRPFVLTTSGRVRGPASIPSVFDCTGSVVVRFYLGRRNISFVLVAVQPDCTFSVQTVFNRLPGRGRAHRHVVLRVGARFRGNGYLQSVSGRSQLVTLG